jgi:hypothetical protein
VLSLAVRRALVLALLALAVWWPTTTIRAQDAGGTPQTRPVMVWFSAVSSGNLEQLKTAFSTSMQRQFEQEGWARVLETYQDSFRKAFGDYSLADFRLEFAGGEDRGYVNVLHRGNKLPAVRVVRESTGWKVDER